MFDHVRSRSSYLLAVTLAIACRFCVETVSQNGSSSTPLAPSQQRHGITLVSEERWMEIRDLAMVGHFQTLISKVHCLGEQLMHQRLHELVHPILCVILIPISTALPMMR